MALNTAQLSELLRPSVEELGYEFWGLEYQTQKGGALMRVYIESDAGINVDDCAKVSRQLSLLLDVEDPVSIQYRLEVSSPGMQRAFFSIEQYARFIGGNVKVQLRFPFDGRKRFKGLLVAVEDNELILHEDGNEYSLPFEGIEKGSLI